MRISSPSTLLVAALTALVGIEEANGFLPAPRLTPCLAGAAPRSKRWAGWGGARIGALRGAPPGVLRARMAFGWEGYEDSRKKNSRYPADMLAGSWQLSWEEEDGEQHSLLIALDQGGTCRPPTTKRSASPGGFSGSWRLKGDQVTVQLRDDVSRSVSGLAVTVFQGRMLDGTDDRPYGSLIRGYVLDGEYDPLCVGKFNLTQVVGGASMGLGPGKPEPLQSRASHGFSMTSRSDSKVLERFSDVWEGSISMDGTKTEFSVKLQNDGSFETVTYSKITTEGVKTEGVLRGRWNVYYSEPQDKDRFWMQILRLKSSGVNLWSDLLLLGDLRPVHTWRDLESQLMKQTIKMQMSQNESTNASAPLQEGEGEEEEEEVESEEDATDLEDRGVFTTETQNSEEAMGRTRRRYEISGTVITGHQFEPTIVGSFSMRMQAVPGDEGSDGAIDVDGGGDGWEQDLGLGGDEL